MGEVVGDSLSVVGESGRDLRRRHSCQEEGSPFSILFYLASASPLHLPECSWDGLIQEIGDLEWPS